jgi:hypothetical protein
LTPEALNQFEPKPMLVAVVAVKLAGRFRLELAPKIIPDGFIRKRLELPPVT